MNASGSYLPIYTYASTQATKCASCGEHKHTPLRIDAMDGYVCLTCIDKKLCGLLGEFGYPADPDREAIRNEMIAKVVSEIRAKMDKIELDEVPIDQVYGLLNSYYPLKSQPAQQACETCGGTGWLGGPSFYSPDEGGVPCDDCNKPAQPSEGESNAS